MNRATQTATRKFSLLESPAIRLIHCCARSVVLVLGLLTSSLNCAVPVRTGADVLVGERLDLLKGKGVGVVCNQTSVFSNGTHLVDSLLALNVRVVAIFGPEHGVRGNMAAGAGVADSVDVKTGLLLHSLYGKVTKPTDSMLAGIDVLVFDLQDVGSRYYTWIYTMSRCMDAAAAHHIKFLLLDRPNPIGGTAIEGPVLDTAYRSAVGMYPVQVRHGMTLGEIARMAVGEQWIENSSSLDLTVIAMEGWTRTLWYDETGIPWVPPSPNMKTLATATVYPGTCLIEGTNMTEGRGTERPFEYCGAPWIAADSLAEAMNDQKLPGIHFEALTFTPQPDPVAAPSPKFKGETCGGLFLHVTDREHFLPFRTAVSILATVQKMYGAHLQLQGKTFDGLAGSGDIRKLLKEGKSAEEILKDEQAGVEQSRRTREKYLLYK